MNLDDFEKRFKDAKFRHLSEEELDSYNDQKLDLAGQTRAEAHLKLCLICERRLTLINEESAALDNRETTDEDVALVRRAMKQTGSNQHPADSMPAEATTEIPLTDRLAEYLRQLSTNWHAHFKQADERETIESVKEVWQWQSNDGVLSALAVLESSADLTIHLSSNRPDLEGVRLKVRLGPVNRKTILQRVSDSEVYARIEVHRRKRLIYLADMSIEII